VEGAQKNKVVSPNDSMETGEPMEMGEAEGRQGPADQPAPLMDRVREYLAKRKLGQTAASQSQEGKKKPTLDPAGTYSTIKKFNENNLVKPNLNGMADSKMFAVGGFFNEGDSRMNIALLRTSYAKKINLSLSFDPTTKNCVCCKGEDSHLIEGGEEGAAPKVFILSDQCFPPYVQLTGGKCPVVIRVENGSLMDIVTSFLEVMGGSGMGVGSLVLLSSASHLGAVGSAAYADEFVRAARRLLAELGGRVDVRHGLPILLEGTDSPHLVRSLHEICHWLGNLRVNGERFPLVSFKKMLETPLGPEQQPDYELRLRMPVSLTQFENKLWASSGWTLPTAMKKLSVETEEELLKTLMVEIAGVYSVPLGELCTVTRSPVIPEKAKPKQASFVLVGSSHARRLGEALQELGATVETINMPSCAPQKGAVEKAVEELMEALVGDEKKHVVMLMLDNAAYFARTEEGSLIPARRGEHGTYHLDGELVIAPAEMFSRTLKICDPLLKMADSAETALLISPLPRYWLQPCCSDPEHAPNRGDVGFEDELYSGLEGLRRHMKDYLFMHRHRNVSVLNSSLLLTEVVTGSASSEANLEALRDQWGPDPVHPSPTCYGNMAKKVWDRVEAKTAGEGRSHPLSSTPGGGGRKRPRWFEAAEQESVSLPRRELGSHSSNQGAWSRGRPWRGRGTWHGGAAGWRGGRRPGRGGYGKHAKHH